MLFDMRDGRTEMRDSRTVSHPPDLPDIVNRAFDVSRRAGYVSFCRNETGRLLAMLAATRDGTMAEFGTGCGVGTAWLRSGVRGEKARIVTAELDPKLAEAAAEIFGDDAAGRGAGRRLVDPARQGPLLAALPRLRASRPRSASTRSPTWSRTAASSSSTTSRPARSWPPITGGRVDTLREQWLTDERFTAVEVMVAPTPPSSPPR